jgi:outer membrane autotransporter protein
MRERQPIPNLAGFSLTITGAGVVNNSSHSPTFSIGAAASLVLQGASVAGNATIITNSGGTFDISGLTSVGATAGSIQGAGTFQLGSKALTVGSNNLSTEVTGALVGTGGGLTKVGTGTLTISGLNNTYSGGTSVTGGTVAVKSDTNLGTGPLTLDGGTLQALASGGGINSSKLITLNSGGGTFSADSTTSSLLSGAISGPGSLTTEGAGTLVLTGANIYSGGTHINGVIVDGNLVGDLSVVSDSNLGTGPLSFDGGTLEILSTESGLTSSKAITLSNNGGTFQTDAGTTSTFSGAISGDGSLDSLLGLLRKNGPGTLVLTGANTYSGRTIVQGGLLQVGSSTALSPNAGMVLFSTLDLHGFDSSVVFLIGSGTVTNNGASSAGLTVGSNVAGAITTFDGMLTDGSSPLSLIVTNGATQLTLTGANTYSGGTQLVNGGEIVVQDNSNLGTGPLLFDGGNLFLFGFSVTTFDKPVTLNSGGGTFTVGFFSTATLSEQVTGPGALTEFGVGTLVLTAVNDYSGGTNIVLGTVEVNGDSNLGSGPLSFDSGTLEALGPRGGISSSKAITLLSGGGTFLADAGTISTLSGPIIGEGSWTKDGLGTLILAGVNTYRGATNVLLGTLEAGSTSSFSRNSAFNVTSVLDLNAFNNTIGSLSGTGIVTNNGGSPAKLTVGLDNTNTIFSGSLKDGSGGLALTKRGLGTLILGGTNTYSGATHVTGGILEAGSSTALSAHSAFTVTSRLELNGFSNTIASLAGTGTVSNQGATLANLTVGGDNSSTTFSGVLIDGPSSLALTKRGKGTLTLTGFNTYRGGTNFNQGTLAVNGGQSLGTGPLNFGGGTLEALATGQGITANQTITLNGGGGTFLADLGTTSLFSGTVSGAGSLTKDGPGKLTLTALNTYSGGTNINGGTLAVNGDPNLGTGPLALSSSTLEVLPNGGIVSHKSIRLTGSGGTILTDAGSASRLEGGISGVGQLTKDGPGKLILAGANTYSGGTTLKAGTLTVQGAQALGFGNVVVNGGTLNADPQAINVRGQYTQTAGGTLQLQIAGAQPGQYDTLNVAGNAQLDGTLQLISLRFRPKAGNLLTLVTTGGAVSGQFARFVDPFVNWDGPHSAAKLLYQPNSVQLLFLNSGSAGSVTGLTAYYEISFSNANIQRLNLEGRMDDLHLGSNGFSSNMKVNGATLNTDDRSGSDGKSSKTVVEPILQPGPENRWGVWMTGFGDFVSVDADANANGYNFTTGGVSLGLDYRLANELVIGVMGEYAHTWTALQPSGNLDVNSGRGGLYATWSRRGIYLNGAIYGGHNNYASSRPGLAGLATGTTDGAELSTFVSGGYDFHFGSLTVGPTAALQYTYATMNGFSENGSLAPMQIESGSANSLRSDVGFRLFYQWQIGKVLIGPSLKAVWEHEYLYSALPITAGFVGVPGSSATFFGPAEGHDSAIVSTGVSVQWTPTWTIYANYDGQLGRKNYDSNAVTGGFRIGF